MPEDPIFEAARTAWGRAIAPFSGFRVGAALETSDGRVIAGCNIENASYGLTVCAERVAIFKALSDGEPEKSFRRIAIFTHAGKLTSPCGACRQIIWEFCGDIPVILFNNEGAMREIRMSALLPEAFDRDSLRIP